MGGKNKKRLKGRVVSSLALQDPSPPPPAAEREPAPDAAPVEVSTAAAAAHDEKQESVSGSAHTSTDEGSLGTGKVSPLLQELQAPGKAADDDGRPSHPSGSDDSSMPNERDAERLGSLAVLSARTLSADLADNSCGALERAETAPGDSCPSLRVHTGTPPEPASPLAALRTRSLRHGVATPVSPMERAATDPFFLSNSPAANALRVPRSRSPAHLYVGSFRRRQGSHVSACPSPNMSPQRDASPGVRARIGHLARLTGSDATGRSWSPSHSTGRERTPSAAWDVRRGSPVDSPPLGLPAGIEPVRKQRCTRQASPFRGDSESPAGFAFAMATPESPLPAALPEGEASFCLQPLKITPKPARTRREASAVRRDRSPPRHAPAPSNGKPPVVPKPAVGSAAEGFEFSLEETESWSWQGVETPFGVPVATSATTKKEGEGRRRGSELFITPLVAKDDPDHRSTASSPEAAAGAKGKGRVPSHHRTFESELSLCPTPRAHTRLNSYSQKAFFPSTQNLTPTEPRPPSPFAFARELDEERVYPIAIMFMERMNYLLLCARYYSTWKRWIDSGHGHRSSTRLSSKMHILNRFLIDSRQVETRKGTYACWLPARPERESFFFVVYPSMEERLADISGRLWRMIRTVASFLLITGHDPYNLPHGQPCGVILFEVSFRNVSGMDFSNGLTSDGRWSVETSSILKRCFHSETAMLGFVEQEGADLAAAVLAMAVAAAVVDASAAVHEGAAPTALVVPCETISTNMVMGYFGDDSAPHLPHALWSILSAPKNAHELKTIESGLPSWAMFLPQRNIYYRTWLRHVIQWICIVWPIITLIAALIDLYRSYDSIRSVINSIGGFFTTIQNALFDVYLSLKAVAWSALKPMLDELWNTLSDWLQSQVVDVVAWIAFAAGSVEEAFWLLWTVITSFPLFSALAETRAYFVSMLLPFVGDLFVACSSAVRLWGRVMSDALRVVTGSATAVWRVVNSVLNMPNWFGSLVRQALEHAVGIFSHIAAVFTYTRKVLPQLFSLFNAQNTATVVQTTADAGVRWAMINSARQAVSGVVTRTYSLTVFIGTEISKHWVTWVQRPLIALFNWISDNSKNILLSVLALFPFGVFSYCFSVIEHAVLDDEAFDYLMPVLLLQDLVIFALSWALVRAASRRVTVVTKLLQNEGIIKVCFAAVVAWISYKELTQVHADKSLNSILLLITLILLSAVFIYQALGKSLGWLIRRSKARVTPVAPPASAESTARCAGRKRKFNGDERRAGPSYDDSGHLPTVAPCLKGSFVLGPTNSQPYAVA
eukprot:TRINITY_DN4296_c0_g1_i1.p1 TRINITY_DN4296_c0_g1~~TRINITY_DN4296_c0_g1_i1.p1  ORF type:complete len:1293 (+),score=258.36 TRINITY_DN4296_c0_g1_i1:133-4011(+)